MTELGLGTAQLGLPYGVSNRRGQPSEDEAAAILTGALRAGIRVFDTAPAYGGSEALLGSLLPADGVRVVTKTPPLEGAAVTAADCDAVRRSAQRSCERLGRDRLDALLLHHGSDLSLPGGELLAEALIGLREQGLAARIGVSVYDRKELDHARELLPLDIVQLPLNAFDQRFLGDGTLDALREEGIEVHARSAFLQGLLLMATEELPDRLAVGAEPLRRYHEAHREAGLTSIQAALGFVRSTGINIALVGANSALELAGCVAAMRAEIPQDLDYAALAIDDVRIIDPRRWPD